MIGARRALALLLAASPAFAQARTTGSKTSPVFRAADAVILGGATAAAIGVMHYDRDIASWIRRPEFQDNGALRHAMTGARLFGDPGTIVLGAALWAGGQMAGNKDVSTDGVSSLEAVALASAVTYLIKGTAGRARPYVDSTNSADFKWGRGFGDRSDYQSFPSGHTTAAFAFASSITARIAQRSPARARWAGPLLYGAATLTGLSRMYDSKHWASDVLLGAGIGTASGLIAARLHER